MDLLSIKGFNVDEQKRQIAEHLLDLVTISSIQSNQRQSFAFKL